MKNEWYYYDMAEYHLEYLSDPKYLLVSQHLEEFDVFLKSTISKYSFIKEENSERLVQEYLNKLYCTLFTLRYSLEAKDSLGINLLAKYVYEIFIDFNYIFKDSKFEDDLVERFFGYKNTPDEHDWIDKSRSQRAKEALGEDFLVTHKPYYSRLNNHAHPSIFSFFANRSGLELEKWIILSTTVMIINTIIQILEHPTTKLYFKYSEQDLKDISSKNTKISSIISPRKDSQYL